MNNTNTEKSWDFDKWSENYDETVLDENWIHDGYTDILNQLVDLPINLKLKLQLYLLFQKNRLYCHN